MSFPDNHWLRSLAKATAHGIGTAKKVQISIAKLIWRRQASTRQAPGCFLPQTPTRDKCMVLAWHSLHLLLVLIRSFLILGSETRDFWSGSFGLTCPRFCSWTVIAV